MSAVVAPLYTAERDGRRLRTFAARGPAPELPWFALADLAAALATTRAEEVELLSGIGAGPLGLRLRTVSTADGPAMLIDHPDAFLLLQLVKLLEDGPASLPLALDLFQEAAMGGMVAAASGLAPRAAKRWALAAWRRGAATIEANAARSRRGGELQGQGSG